MRLVVSPVFWLILSVFSTQAVTSNIRQRLLNAKAEPLLEPPFLDQVDATNRNTAQNVIGLIGPNEHHKGVSHEFSHSDANTHERVTLTSFPDHSLRVSTKATTLCDHTVKQHTGYLDIADGKHLFFWYFEARNKPTERPLLLWLNGGPGCSSSTGLLLELGPCTVRRNNSAPEPYAYTEINRYSWNHYSNMIFLDQPVNVGFSYSSDSSNSSTINSAAAAALDVYAFLQLFYSKFPELKDREFHVAAESYGGHYAPNIGKVIHERNAELDALVTVKGLEGLNGDRILYDTERTQLAERFKIPLASIILANGLTEPRTQFASMPEYFCTGPYPLFENNSEECADLRSKALLCTKLIKLCYDTSNPHLCYHAGVYCEVLTGPLFDFGLNPYDVRRTCDRSPDKDGEHCYQDWYWMEEWLNRKDVKTALGIDPQRNFTSCNHDVGNAFATQGDQMRNSARLLVPLLNDGIRLLVYSGEADGLANFMGNFNWMFALEGHAYTNEFRNATTRPWYIPSTGSHAGDVRAAYGDLLASTTPKKSKGPNSVGNYVFASVHGAGHLVPHDNPEAALDLIRRWLEDLSLTS